MDDSISRAAVLEVIREYCPDEPKSKDLREYWAKRFEPLIKVREEIEKIPLADRWIPCNVALPKTEERVSVTCEHLDIYGKPHRYVCKAYHVDRYTVRADFDYWDEGCDEYCEEDDQYYVLEGWYECIHNWGDYSSVRITEDKVVAWCELPKPWEGGEK